MAWFSDAAVLKRLDALGAQFAELNRLLQQVILGELIMSNDISSLQTAVAADTDATNSALKLIKGISAQLAAAQGDSTKIQALVDQLNANATALSAAVVSNTPSDPTSAPTVPNP